MSSNKPQSYENHSKLVAGYHFVLASVVLLILVLTGILVYRALTSEGDLVLTGLVVLFAVATVQLTLYVRLFPLKAQDRAIRAEEKLRHFVLTGQPVDPRLETRQLIGLRFASDEEFPALAKRAAEEGLSERAIKKCISSWRADEYRV